ncbi:unnamed protein product [Cylicocyclus nassatus]|uniref:Peptidase A1 domain-containing protein n=1 Tax=Cylicocyclus nassatus TaxID=53992 RepID=A0AA36DJV0_CYLNA|nr:unnamed protein product [Cylicocyclus nassatus]
MMTRKILLTIAFIASASTLNFTMKTISSHSLSREQLDALRRHPQIAAWRRSKRQAPAWTFQLLHDYYDEFYLGTVTFGNPGQELWLAMDTGSSIIWVIDDACNTAECNGYPKSGLNKRKFRKDLSRTFASMNRSFIIHYHTGWTSGIAAQDTVRFGGYALLSQPFGVANKLAPFLARIPIEGVFGLGLPSKTASGNLRSPMEALVPYLTLKLITVWMNRKIEISKGGDGGYITYGKIDDVNCQQTWNYVPLSSQTHWKVPMQGFAMSSYRYRRNNDQALVDTGSSYISVPKAVLEAIARFTGARYSAINGVYTVPCTSMWTLPDILFQMNGIQYSVPSAQYVIDMGLGDRCVLAFYPIDYDTHLGISWILGAPFIRAFCTIFDYGQRQLGFAVSIPR